MLRACTQKGNARFYERKNLPEMSLSADEKLGRIKRRAENARRTIARLGGALARAAPEKSFLPALLARTDREFQRVLLVFLPQNKKAPLAEVTLF